MIRLPPTSIIPVPAIIAATEQIFGLQVGGLRKNHGRPAMICGARQIAMYVIREHSSYSLPQIGRAFGGFHHTTVLHSIRMVTESLGRQPALTETIGRICEDARAIAATLRTGGQIRRPVDVATEMARVRGAGKERA